MAESLRMRIRKKRDEERRRWYALCIGLAVVFLAFGIFFLFQREDMQKSYLYPYPYQEITEMYAATYHVESSLVASVIMSESKFKNDVHSHRGAMGLMQLMPGTARRFGVADPWDPEQNVHGGVRYLRELLDRFQNLKLALAAYNAGEGAVEQHGNQVPPYEETQTYVQRVMGLFFRNLDRDG